MRSQSSPAMGPNKILPSKVPFDAQPKLTIPCGESFPSDARCEGEIFSDISEGAYLTFLTYLNRATSIRFRSRPPCDGTCLCPSHKSVSSPVGYLLCRPEWHTHFPLPFLCCPSPFQYPSNIIVFITKPNLSPFWLKDCGDPLILIIFRIAPPSTRP